MEMNLNKNSINVDIQPVDYLQRTINTTINLNELDNPRNLEYKSYFYLNLTAKEQESLLGLDFKNFIRELDKSYRIYIKGKKLKSKTKNSFFKKILNIFK